MYFSDPSFTIYSHIAILSYTGAQPSRAFEIALRAATAYYDFMQMYDIIRYVPFIEWNCCLLYLTLTSITFRHPNKFIRYSRQSTDVGNCFSQLLAVSMMTSIPKHLQNWRTADRFYSIQGVCSKASRMSDTMNLLSSMIRCETLKLGMIRLAKNVIMVVYRIRIGYTVSLSYIKYSSIFNILRHAQYYSIFY